MRLFVVRCGLFLAAGILCAQSAAFVTVNAASYGSTVAPDSLVTIFGTGLATTTATAVLDASGQLPTELASTQVQIAGIAAPLLYVSPTQINLVAPAGIDAGTVDVVVKSTSGGTSQTATVLVAAAAAGVFTSDASGTGAGSILNAVTYAPAPFTVQTTENGADTRTRLAIYGTGFRHATTVTATTTDPAGNRFNLTVEYAGAAPGFIGLDQVNVVLPADLDVAGTVTLLLGADNRGANPVTIEMKQFPAIALQLATISISPAYLNSGDLAVLTVGLNGVARNSGTSVVLSSRTSAAVVAAQVTIPAGRSSAQTNVNTLPVPATVQAPIQAVLGGVTLSTVLEINPANTVQLTRLAIAPASVQGGRNLTGTLTLSGPAPGTGLKVAVASDSTAVTVPAVVTVPFGRSSFDFAITSVAVTQTESATVTASYGHVSTTASVAVRPPLELTLDPSAVVAGGSVTGTVTLGEGAPAGGAVVVLASSDLTVRAPFSVTVPAGQTAVTFTVTTTGPVAAARVVTLTASYSGFKQTATLTVTPQAAPTLSSLTVTPNPVTGGNTAQGTVTLTSAASGPVTVSLFSSSAFATVGAAVVTIPQGQRQATFTIATSKVSVTSTATITATALGVSKSVTLTVQ